MSMRKDLMIMKILLDTMGILNSHMNIVVVLVIVGGTTPDTHGRSHGLCL